MPDYFRRSFCRLSQPCFFDGLGHGGGGAQRRVNEEEREALRQKLHQNWDDGEEEILTEWVRFYHWHPPNKISFIGPGPKLVGIALQKAMKPVPNCP